MRPNPRLSHLECIYNIGKNMRNCLSLLILASSAAFGNPIVVMDHGTYYADKKASEMCVAVVGETSSLVSCDVSYRLKQASAGPDSYYVFVALPVFVAADETTGDEALGKIFEPRIEFDGKVFPPDAFDRPSRIRKRDELARYSAPKGVDVVFFRFSIEVGYGKREARLLVRYRQPTIAGKFLYVPLFEDGAAAKKDIYRFEAVAADSSLQIAADGKGWSSAFPSRLSRYLSHDSLLSITVRKANQSPAPTVISVTPRAAQEARQP